MNLKLLSALAFASSFTLTPAFAAGDGPRAAPTKKEAAEADKEPSDGAQQNKMKTCNEKAKKQELRGDERRQFMSSCLKSDRH